MNIPEGVRFAHLCFTDLLGGADLISVPAGLAASLSGGFIFDGSATEGFARTFEEDKRLLPDEDTAFVSPLDPGAMRVICDMVELEGTPSPIDPRGILRRSVSDADSQGLALEVGWELEFFLLHPDLRPADVGAYFGDASPETTALVEEAVEALAAARVPVSSLHSEVAPGQWEIDLAPQPALAAADAVVTAKHVLRRAADRRGLLASFMPKPFEHAAGSGLHLQLGLTARGQPALVEKGRAGALSPTGSAFVAGLLAHASGLCALAAPLVNSYRRLAAEQEAPVQAVWAHVNRAAMVRVSKATDTTAPVELRLPDSAANPYLLLAAVMAAGRDGIDGEVPLPGPVEEDLYEFEPASADSSRAAPLPATLTDALTALETDEVLADALGSALLDRYLTARRIEAEGFSRHVSQWERDRYLTTS